MGPQRNDTVKVLAPTHQELHDDGLLPMKRSYANAPKGAVTKVDAGDDSVVLTRVKGRANMGDEAIVDMRSGECFQLGLFLYSFEACQTLAAMSVVRSARRVRTPMHSPPRFFTLPREIRDMIYEFALPDEIPTVLWDRSKDEIRNLFFRGIGDPNGALLQVPTTEEINLLLINHRIRGEALREVVRRCKFRVVHDQVIQFLLSIGRTGRENIQSLEIKWQNLDTPLDVHLYPSLRHESRYAELVRQCGRLRSLRLIFPSPTSPNNTWSGALSGDAQIMALISPLVGIKKLMVKFEIGYNVTGDEPKVVAFLDWLKSVIKPATFDLEKAVRS
ncbi:hypothetical protein OQA88_11477 [Cercophora sp. LCS_1]